MTEQDMRSGHPVRAMVLLLLAILLAMLLVPAATPAQDAETDWNPVTVIYQTDVKGKIEPCG